MRANIFLATPDGRFASDGAPINRDMPPPNHEDSYRLAYDESIRALDQQETAVDGFRSRAGILISAAAITTSFLGAKVLEGGQPDLTSWLAISAFLGVVGFCLAVLWPTKWEFSADAGDLIATYIETVEPMSTREIHRDLALHMRDSHMENSVRLKQLVRWFQFAVFLLSAEIVFWVASYEPWS